MRRALRLSLAFFAFAFAIATTCALAAGSDWAIYGGTSDGNRHSSLTQITKANVGKLAQAWSFPMEASGDAQTHPLAIDGVIYAYTPSLKVVALDGASGKQIWQFDSGVAGRGAQRGLTWWSDGKEKRLFASVMHFLYALDPATGKPIESFGENGRIDMRQNLSRDSAELYVSLTTPGVIYRDTIITGFRTAESAPAAPGDIRAFDVRTGKLRWAFRTIPKPGDGGYESWPPDAWKSVGGANAWAGMVVDHKRGIVFAPTGSAVDDFYGAQRLGNNFYANSLLALDANTGKRLWHFQGVRHDIFDRDFPSPPVLMRLRHQGRIVDAVAQPTKQGFLFVLDRVTGKPLFPVEDMPVPPSNVPGETAASSQPMSRKPAPFARQHLTEDMLTNRTPQANAWALSQFRTFHNDGPFAPMRLGQQTVAFPGFDGGAEWGGSAADPARGILYINANDIAWTGGLSDAATAGGPGAIAYQANCAVCHGQDRSGAPPAFPGLIDIGKRLNAQQITEVIHTGRGRMPGFANLQGDTLKALLEFLITGKDDAQQREVTGNAPSKYRFTGYRKFLDPDGYPAVAQPWGTLNAIDLNTGEYLWKIALGEYPELAAQGLTNTGSENYGGPILTQSGLLFIGATVYDKKLRAFDAGNGKLLWQATLPFAGTATPITYSAGGQQLVLIHTSNARDKKAPQGSAYVAFALPR
jgi:quinoprotein glucose dehydrogenase